MKMISERSQWKGRTLIRTWIKLNSIKNLSPITQVYAFCFNNDGKIMLVKDPFKEFWNLPGGKPIEKETYIETLIREVNEEATCVIENIKILGAIKITFLDNKEEFYQLRCVAKIKKINKQTIDPDRGYKLKRIFISPKDYIKYASYDNLIGPLMLKIAIQKLKF